MQRKIYLFLTMLFATLAVQAQNYKAGEFLKYRIHYTGLNAGYATLEVKDEVYNGKEHFHVVGHGQSTGAVKLFFKVIDNYETYINKNTFKPSKHVRNIHEGTYKRHEIYYFDQDKKQVKIDDIKTSKSSSQTIPSDIQDIISAFYSIRNVNYKTLKIGDYINENIFLVDETYKFRLKVLGREVKKTKFGKVNTIKIRPYVQSGRVFKESESVTMWVTDDENLIPVHIKASLAVGSLNAELSEYKNVKYPIHFFK